MSKPKTPLEERAVIVGRPQKRPYGVKLRLHVLTAGSIGYLENVCVLLKTGAFLTVSPLKSAPWEGGKKYLFTLEGFPTASAAEQAGSRLTLSLLALRRFKWI